jgi:hypothetical protein
MSADATLIVVAVLQLAIGFCLGYLVWGRP